MEPERSLHHAQEPANCLSWATSIHSLPHPTSRRSILILSSRLRLGIPIGLLPSGFLHQNSVFTSTLPISAMCPANLSSWFGHPNNNWWAVQSIKLLIMYSFPLPCYLVPRRSICPPQHRSRKPAACIPPLMWATKFHTHIKQYAKL